LARRGWARKHTRLRSGLPFHSRFPCSLPFILACVFASIGAANSQNAPAPTEITLTYTLVINQISPKTGIVKSSWSRTFRLSGKNVVSKTVSMNGKTLLTESTALGESGEGVSGINGITYRVGSKVVGGEMVMTEESKTYVNTMTIRTDGRTHARRRGFTGSSRVSGFSRLPRQLITYPRSVQRFTLKT
jgi:hypothetical protein